MKNFFRKTAFFAMFLVLMSMGGIPLAGAATTLRGSSYISTQNSPSFSFQRSSQDMIDHLQAQPDPWDPTRGPLTLKFSASVPEGKFFDDVIIFDPDHEMIEAWGGNELHNGVTTRSWQPDAASANQLKNGRYTFQVARRNAAAEVLETDEVTFLVSKN